MPIRSSVFQYLALTMGCAEMLFSAHAGLACAAAPPLGTFANVATEEAAIIWDNRSHMERFIRHASFTSDAHDFGFLVPTPEPPQLTETPSDLFQELDDTYHPKYIRKPRYGLKLTSLSDYVFPGFGMAGPDLTHKHAAVQVLRTQEVGGYDATVLRADNTGDLENWLQKNGYATRPALAQWLAPYVSRHWAITAFKIAKSEASETASSTVQMSFHSDHPFFPYSEPADQRDPGGHTPQRLLRLFVLANSRMDGRLESSQTIWPGQVAWAQVLTQERDDSMNLIWPTPQPNVNPFDKSPSLWLTAFEDQSSPRPGVADLIFLPSPSQLPVAPKPVLWPIDRRYGVPIDFIVIAAFLSIRAIRRRRKRYLHPGSLAS